MKLNEYLDKNSISKSDFAKSIDVSAGMLSQWLSSHRPIAPAQCIAIERITNGQVTRQELRDDWQDIWPTDMPPLDDQRHLSERRQDRRRKIIK